MLVRHFAGDAAWVASERGLDEGEVALRDVLQRQAAQVRGSFEVVSALLRERVRVDPSFAPFVAACRARRIALSVLSSGITAIIRGRLAEVGVGDLPVIANDVETGPGGWRIRFRDPGSNGTDKAAVLRAARERGEFTLFFGDGRSDYEAAALADQRYARRGLPLERYLRNRGLPFVAFSSFAEIDLAALAAPTLYHAP